jgi:hypothetical protein
VLALRAAADQGHGRAQLDFGSGVGVSSQLLARAVPRRRRTPPFLYDDDLDLRATLHRAGFTPSGRFGPYVTYR